MTFECCQYGDNMVDTDDGDPIFGELCDCICHIEENYEYEE